MGAKGHRFGFYIYCDRETAASICMFLRSKEAVFLESLRNIGFLHGLVWAEEHFGPNQYRGLENDIARITEDYWHDCTRQVWHHFAQGASRSWIESVKWIREDVTGLNRNEMIGLPISDCINAYALVEQRIRAIFLRDVEAGYIHHLDAIFGYYREKP